MAAGEAVPLETHGKRERRAFSSSKKSKVAQDEKREKGKHQLLRNKLDDFDGQRL